MISVKLKNEIKEAARLAEITEKDTAAIRYIAWQYGVTEQAVKDIIRPSAGAFTIRVDAKKEGEKGK